MKATEVTTRNVGWMLSRVQILVSFSGRNPCDERIIVQNKGLEPAPSISSKPLVLFVFVFVAVAFVIVSAVAVFV